MIRRTLKFPFLCLAGGLACAPAAMAEATKVGEAEIIRNEVVNVGEAELIPINVGDDLLRDAVIRTSTDSDARFGLIDNTKLTLGPGSTLKIDRAVYSDPSHYKQITIRLTEGAFRFITGNSILQDRDAYCVDRRSRHHSRYPDFGEADPGGVAGRQGQRLRRKQMHPTARA
jgi:hypothetical protein